MTFREMMQRVAKDCQGYVTLGVKVPPEQIVAELAEAQRYVAGDLLNYGTRSADPSVPDPFETELTLSQTANLPKDGVQDPDLLAALDPIQEFTLAGDVEPSLPAYAHGAIVARAVWVLLGSDAPKSLVDRYTAEVTHARRTLLQSKEDRPVRIEDKYDPYRFMRAEW